MAASAFLSFVSMFHAVVVIYMTSRQFGHSFVGLLVSRFLRFLRFPFRFTLFLFGLDWFFSAQFFSFLFMMHLSSELPFSFDFLSLSLPFLYRNRW